VSIAVAITIPCADWRRALPRASGLARRAAREALRQAAYEGDGEVSVVLADDATVADLNRRYRRRRGPTNVLSFSATPPLLGDVVIAYETTAREAKAQHKPLADHFAHLVVHGTLHLLGHDHRRAAEARRMESLEIVTLFRLGIADPYNDGAR